MWVFLYWGTVYVSYIINYIIGIWLITRNRGSNSTHDNNSHMKDSSTTIDVQNTPSMECTVASASLGVYHCKTPCNSDWYFKYLTVFSNSQSSWLITLITHDCNVKLSPFFSHSSTESNLRHKPQVEQTHTDPTADGCWEPRNSRAIFLSSWGALP